MIPSRGASCCIAPASGGTQQRRSGAPRAPWRSTDRGDALARAGDYAAALDAFDAALAADPQDADVRANRALLAGLLAARAADALATGRSGAAGVKAASRDLPPPPTPASSLGGEGFVGTRQSRSAALSRGVSTVAPPRAPSPEPGVGRGAAAHGSAAAGSGRIGLGGDLAVETPAAVGRAPPDRAAARERQQATEQWIATIHDDPARFLRLRFELEHQRRLAAGIAPPPADDPW